MTPTQQKKFFTILQQENPNPRTELHFSNHYQLLVAVVLSAQATDKGVNAATAALFKTVKTPAAMLELGEAGLIQHIRTIGLFRAKAKNVIELSRQLIEHHRGKIPNTREALQALPGVGRKTANVVLNEAYGQPTIAVDTHIYRVSNRTGLATGKTVREVEDKLEANIEDKYKRHAHHWLILLGRYTCKARKPQCSQCKVTHCCDYYSKLPEKTDARYSAHQKKPPN